MTTNTLETLAAGPEEFLAREYEQRCTAYSDDKARALRAGDRSGFIRTDIAVGAVAAALSARAQKKDEPDADS